MQLPFAPPAPVHACHASAPPAPPLLPLSALPSPGILYDGSLRLFRLVSASSQYTFRVDDARNLEHLYWGPTLPDADDITYLTRAHVPAPFDPKDTSLAAKLGLVELETITDGGVALTESWRVFTREKNDLNVSKDVRLKARRLENASWRLWHMERMNGGDLNRDLSEGVLTEALMPGATNGERGGGMGKGMAGVGGASGGHVPPARLPPSAVGRGGMSRNHTVGGGLSGIGAAPASPRPSNVPSSYRSNPFDSFAGAAGSMSPMGFGGGNVGARVRPHGTPEARMVSPREGGRENGADASSSCGKDLAGTMAGLDLDGYRGSKQHFRAELKSRLCGGGKSNQSVSSMEEVVLSSAGRPSVGNATLSDGGLGIGGGAGGGMANGSPLVARGSPAGGMRRGGGGLGSRKPSFAALESHVEMDAGAEVPFELSSQSLSSATNWELLDPEVVGKSSKLLEFSDCGTGDFREPSFKVRYDSDGSTVSPLEYSKHRIFKGKPAMPAHMPGLYIESPDEATTLIVEMVDRVTKLKMNLYFTVFHEYDVITRRSVVVNDGDKPVCLNHLVSATVDFDAEGSFYMTQLSGGWAREREVVTRKLDDGLTVVKSSRGASSHQFNPFLVISPDRQPEERHGECFSFCLVYSGNFLGTAEVTEYARLRVNMGLNPENFTWSLQPSTAGIKASSFHSPEIVMSYSNTGLGGMSRQLHRIFRERLIPATWRYKIPPVLLNTWEASYFDVSHDTVVDIARKAVTAGIELLVLDDGWFGKRNDTYSGLGDWTPNMGKLPQGLEGLASEVNQLGLKFGIWVEPEMVSIDSDLYRSHPDWCLHVPARARTTGRNQLVLDFSRQCVRDNIFEQLSAMLASANIDYVKWDMNRHLTEVFSQDWDPSRQGEISHRYVLGVYEVFARITAAFPKILFESCSGGGGRFDAGMLFFSSQIWASDNTDALSRVRIQYGTSLAYPASTMGAHVSVVPNHQTLRSTTVKTRSLVAMSGTFGYELDPREMSETDIIEIRGYISLQKCIAQLVYEGDMYRLSSPFSSDSCAWMFVSRNKSHAVVITVNVHRDVGRLEPRLRLDGLLPNAIYSVEELCPGTMARNADTGAIVYEPRGVYQYGRVLRLSGSTLCRAGLPIKFGFDADSLIFELRQEASL